MEKLIVTCAPTGSLTVPTQTPYLPITPQQIAAEAVRATEAGAAVVHIHARDRKDGRPTSDLEIFRDIITKIKRRSDVVIGLTTGGAGGMIPEERIKVVPTFKPELASFNMGPVCISLSGVTKRYRDEDYKYPWEKDYLQMLEGFIQQNTFSSLGTFLRVMNENETKNECECYDVSHIYNIYYFFEQGMIKPPIWIQFVTGVQGSIGSFPEDIVHMKHTADRLLDPDNYQWSIIGAGLNYLQTATLAIALGGHVRVGMEDNIFLERGRLAKSNAELVDKIVRIAKEFGREIATPEEARQVLGLKGKDKVNY
jgi:uncharacterized protein (DUF849 family)